MRHCIPDELINTIPYPNYGMDEVGLDGMYREIRYKVPVATDVMVKKEIWHTVCDFCGRLGALLDKSSESTGEEVALTSSYGRFIRVVGVREDGNWISSGFEVRANDARNGFVVAFDKSGAHDVVFSVQPGFSYEGRNPSSDGFSPVLPKWFVEKYGECIVHGALMRLFVMPQPWGDAGLARMHACAYNNDLTKFSFGLITSGMRKHLLVDVEDMVVAGAVNANGNG